MPLSQRLKVDLGFAVALVFLAAVGLVAYRSVLALRADQDAVTHTQQVLRAAERVGSHLKDAETGQRGYLLTRDTVFLEPYLSASRRLDADLLELRSLLEDPAQRAHYAVLEGLAHRRLEHADRVVAIARAGDFEGAVDVVRAGAGREVMDRALEAIGQLTSREFELLQARQGEANATSRRTVIVVLVTSLAGVLVVTGSRRQILSDLRLRERAERALAQNEAALRGLYEIASSTELGYEEKLDGLVRMGRHRLGASAGAISRIHDEFYELVAASDERGDLHSGDVYPLAAAYCSLVAADREVKEWHHAGASELAGTRPYRESRVESYIGAPLVVNGAVYGTVSFSDPSPRAEPFSRSEKDFVRLVAQWVEGEIARQEAERALRESEQRYRLLAEASLESLVLTQEGRIVDANRAYCEIVGLPLERIVGRSPLDFIAPESYATIQEALRSGTTEPYEVIGQRPDGSQYFLEARGRATTFQGRPARITAIRDVTARAHAEQHIRDSEERYRSLVEAASDIIYRTDLKGHFTYVNPVAVQIMGYPEERLLGMHYTDLVRDDVREVAREFYSTQLLNAVPVTYYEFPAVTAEGREVWIGQNVRLLREGGALVGVQAVARDITRQREVERLKDEFLSVVSHELRTPLTAIRGSLGLLASGKMGTLEERGQRMLEIAAQNTERLVRLINDLLDFEKIRAGRASMERQELDAGELMTHGAEVMRPLAEKAGVRLQVEPLHATLFADPDRVAQVVANLLSNAIKYSPEGGTIHFGGERREGEAVFWVRDDGRGIPEDKRELIFERFQQVDSSDARQKGGTGLGLPIARSIVQQHGGRMWVQSRWGEGSIFYFALPLHAPEPASREEQGPVVLVCDDDAGVRALVREFLRRAGYRVLIGHSGEETLELARDRQPAVVLLDLNLPGMNGREVLDALRRGEETRAIPVVVLTGAGEDAELDQSEIIGWVEKPIDREGLLRTVEWAVSHQREQCSVFVVEDNDDLAGVLETMVVHRGLTVRRASNGREAIEMSRRLTYGLLVLDPGLPDVDGYGVVDWLRRHNRHREVPVLVYTAQELDDGEKDRLRLGPTEFMVKTKVSLDELERRIASVFEAQAAG